MNDFDIDYIIVELSNRIENVPIDFNNNLHIVKLREILKEEHWTEQAVNEFVTNIIGKVNE